MEGVEETLTLNRSNVDKELRRSLRTTNIVEHLNSQANEVLRRIKRWSTRISVIGGNHGTETDPVHRPVVSPASDPSATSAKTSG